MNQVNPSEPHTIPKFVDELPIPPVIKPKKRVNNHPYYEISMKKAMHSFHSSFPATTIWGYEGIFPGPTIETTEDETIYVQWKNQLPQKHFLPIDRTLHGGDDSESRTVVHVHGAHVAPDSDGFPESWFTKDFKQTGPTFSRKIYEYTNHQSGTTLWYHDHAIGITRLNVYAGLAGFYLIKNRFEQQLPLPTQPYEIPLFIADKSFRADGSLFYPDNTTPPSSIHPSVVPAFLGNTITVNGKVWPQLTVEPRKYRFRLLNGSNTRAYTLALENDGDFHLIGTDGGFIPSPIQLNELPLEPAERADIIIDFSTYKGQKLILKNKDAQDDLSMIMCFNVNLPLKQADRSKIPTRLPANQQTLQEENAIRTRLLTLDGRADEYGRPLLLLDNRMWHDPITEKPTLDTIEIWKFINLTDFSHPMHVHLVMFKILHRQEFDVEHFNETGEIKYIGPPTPPRDYEKGWKDIVKAEPHSVASIIMKFENFTGDYVWHCHILEHEDYDMMRPFQVIENNESI